MTKQLLVGSWAIAFITAYRMKVEILGYFFTSPKILVNKKIIPSIINYSERNETLKTTNKFVSKGTNKTNRQCIADAIKVKLFHAQVMLQSFLLIF